MSPDDAKSVLAPQGLQFETNSDGNLDATTDVQIMLPGLKQTVPMRPELRFTSTGGLMDVTLQVDVMAAKQNLTQYHTDLEVLTFLADVLARAVIAKYGVPVYSTTGCSSDLRSTNGLDCVTTIHATDQSISIGWINHPTHLFLRYQMLSPDL